MKNKSFTALAVAIAVQIAAFIGMAGYSVKSHNDIMSSAEYKMSVYLMGGYSDTVYFTTVTKGHYQYVNATNNGYITIAFEEDGMAYFNEKTDKRPEGDLYVKPNMKNCEKFNNYEIKNTDNDRFYDFTDNEYTEAYITFKAHNGEATVTGLYIDDVPAEEWIKTLP